MSHSYVGCVNVQILHTRHHLGLVAEEKNTSDRIRNLGVMASAAWHLMRAFQFYLVELGANYQVPNPERISVSRDLCDALSAIDKHPAEANELRALEETGWIADLAAVLKQTERHPLAKKLSSGVQDALDLTDLDTTSVNVDVDQLALWLTQFQELIERQRGLMVEY